ncbi:DUF4113 domain-containing protein [Escherichia coli]|nr:DUF4113 domain-containing protein [Escherichia coli]
MTLSCSSTDFENDSDFRPKREMLSQCYTTKWRDIPLARLG